MRKRTVRSRRPCRWGPSGGSDQKRRCDHLARTGASRRPGIQKIGYELVRGAVHDDYARLATEEEITKLLPQFELGAIPPIPSLIGLPAYIDPEILKHETLIVPAGVSNLSVRGRRNDLIGDEPINRILTRHPEEAA